MPTHKIVTATEPRELTNDDWCRLLFGTSMDGVVQRFKNNTGGFRDEVMGPQEQQEAAG